MRKPNYRLLGERHSCDQLVKEGSLTRRAITAKTVNEELHSLEASCRRIQRRLAAKPGDAKLTDLLAKQVSKLEICMMAAVDGRTYRHR